MDNLTQQQKYKINSIDMSQVKDIQIEEATGYYDSSIDPYRTEFKGNDIHIDGNVIIFCSVIGAIFIFISQYCLNNFGISLHEHYRGTDQSNLIFGKQNMCQNFISIILSFEYPIISVIGYIIIIALLIVFLYLIGVWDSIINFFKEEKYNYDNNRPNIFSKVTNFDFSKGSTKLFKCATKKWINTDEINKVLKAKKKEKKKREYTDI